MLASGQLKALLVCCAAPIGRDATCDRCAPERAPTAQILRFYTASVFSGVQHIDFQLQAVPNQYS